MSAASPTLGLAAPDLDQPTSPPARSALPEIGRLGRLAGPMIAAGMLNMGLSLTDTAMMGWLDPRALASGIIVSDTYSILFYFAASMVAAVAPLAAASIGGKDHRRAGAIVGQGLWLLIPLALACAAMVASSVGFVVWLGVDLPLREPAEDYAALMGGAFAFMLVFAWGRAALSAMGRQRVPMYLLAAGLPLNAIGNYAFMYGALGFPEMGLAGAGASSLLVAMVVAAGTVGYMLAPSMRHFQILGGLMRPEPAMVLRLVPVGLMMALTTVAETGIYLGSTVLMGLVAAEALAAHAVVFRMLGLGYVIVVGFGQAVMIRVADRDGAGDAAGLAGARRAAQIVATIAAGCALLAFLAVSRFTTSIDAADPVYADMLAEVTMLLPIVGIAMAGLVFGNIHASILRGRTDVRVPAMIAVAGYWGAGGTAMATGIFLFDLGAAGVWAGLAAGTACVALGTSLYLAHRSRVVAVSSSPV